LANSLPVHLGLTPNLANRVVQGIQLVQQGLPMVLAASHFLFQEGTFGAANFGQICIF
jgi:hypothetical protein